jgi:hypothetical protein
VISLLRVETKLSVEYTGHKATTMPIQIHIARRAKRSLRLLADKLLTTHAGLETTAFCTVLFFAAVLYIGCLHSRPLLEEIAGICTAPSTRIIILFPGSEIALHHGGLQLF